MFRQFEAAEEDEVGVGPVHARVWQFSHKVDDWLGDPTVFQLAIDSILCPELSFPLLAPCSTSW